MYENRNTGTGNRMRGTRGMGECHIPGNVAKYSGECCQTFRGISSNIPGNVAKHSGECSQTFRGMSPNILGSILKHSGECRQTFWGMSQNIPGNVAKRSGECRKTFQEHSSNILHALNSQIQLILTYISIPFQKWNYLSFIFINESKVFQV